ncbi:hypothetical protein JB92DRAFT_2830688 [Gautieria morchelliformis]|nr:hypothetical protein JB92DRAFT_2830688 [Gautieria morchelliformis]
MDIRVQPALPLLRRESGTTEVGCYRLGVEYGAAAKEEYTWLASAAPVASSLALSPSSSTCTCTCVLPPRNILQVLDRLPSAHSPHPPPLPYILHPPAITSPWCCVCMPRIVMVPAVHAGGIRQGHGQSMGDDAALGVDGAGAQFAEHGVQLGRCARGGGAYKSAPAPAGGETLRVNEEEVSERMEGVREGVEGTEMVPPRSACGISIDALPFVVLLCLELTVCSRAWEMFAPDTVSIVKVSSRTRSGIVPGEFETSFLSIVNVLLNIPGAHDVHCAKSVAKYFLGGIMKEMMLAIKWIVHKISAFFGIILTFESDGIKAIGHRFF